MLVLRAAVQRTIAGEASVAQMPPGFLATVAATQTDPRTLFANPLGSGKCSCGWPGHGIYHNAEEKGGRFGRTDHA